MYLEENKIRNKDKNSVRKVGEAMLRRSSEPRKDGRREKNQ